MRAWVFCLKLSLAAGGSVLGAVPGSQPEGSVELELEVGMDIAMAKKSWMSL